MIPPVLYSLRLRNEQINEPVRIRRRKAEFPDEGPVRAPISEFGFGMALGARPRQIPQKAGSLWNLLGISGRRLRGGSGRRRTGRLGDPALIYLVWVGVGIFVLMVANTLAELVTAIPKAGGPYVYVRPAFGDYLGFVSGWGDYAIYVLADGYLAIAGSEFLGEICPL